MSSIVYGVLTFLTLISGYIALLDASKRHDKTRFILVIVICLTLTIIFTCLMTCNKHETKENPNKLLFQDSVTTNFDTINPRFNLLLCNDFPSDAWVYPKGLFYDFDSDYRPLENAALRIAGNLFFQSGKSRIQPHSKFFKKTIEGLTCLIKDDRYIEFYQGKDFISSACIYEGKFCQITTCKDSGLTYFAFWTADPINFYPNTMSYLISARDEIQYSSFRYLNKNELSVDEVGTRHNLKEETEKWGKILRTPLYEK